MGTFENKRVIKHDSRRRMNKKLRTIQLGLQFAALGIVAIGIIVLIYTLAYAKYTHINLCDQTKVTLNGYDGNANIEAVIEPVEGLEGFFTTVGVEFDKTEALSNGDEVKLTYSYDKEMAKELKIRVKGRSQKVKVKDLPEGSSLTPEQIFADVQVVFEGVSPLVTANIVNNTTDELMSTAEFVIVSDKEFYKKGDAVTVQATFDPEVLRTKAFELSSGTNTCTKDYIVDGVDEYITDASELPQELLDEMKLKGTTLFGNDSGDANEFGLRIFCDAGIFYDTENGQYTFSWRTPVYLSSYFSMISEDHIGENGTHVNDVKIAYDTAVSQSRGETVSAEAVVCFRDIVRHADGTVDADLDSGYIISASRDDSEIKNIVRSQNDEQYTAVKLEQ